MAGERRKRRIERLLDEAEEAVSSLDWEVVRDPAQMPGWLEPESADALDLLTAAERSLGISSELGMRPLMERVLSPREILRA